MSDWTTIESGVVGMLAELTAGQGTLLATAKTQTSRDRKALAEAIGRERLPTAYVILTGRDAGKDAAGRAQLSVLLATRSLRDEAEARLDGQGVRGMWSIAQAVSGALHGHGVGMWGLSLIDERPVAGEDGTVIWEQRYALGRLAETMTPLFGSEELVTGAGDLTVEVGALGRASETFSFPGVDGVFERFLGVRERAIFWRGRLRATRDDTLTGLEARIENQVRAGRSATVVDPWGRTFTACVMKAFRRRGPRVRDELTGEAIQEFEIEFTQLGAG